MAVRQAEVNQPNPANRRDLDHSTGRAALPNPRNDDTCAVTDNAAAANRGRATAAAGKWATRYPMAMNNTRLTKPTLICLVTVGTVSMPYQSLTCLLQRQHLNERRHDDTMVPCGTHYDGQATPPAPLRCSLIAETANSTLAANPCRGRHPAR